jgi:hypothetical protein
VAADVVVAAVDEVAGEADGAEEGAVSLAEEGAAEAIRDHPVEEAVVTRGRPGEEAVAPARREVVLRARPVAAAVSHGPRAAAEVPRVRPVAAAAVVLRVLPNSRLAVAAYLHPPRSARPVAEIDLR